jgi:hypothetical protein
VRQNPGDEPNARHLLTWTLEEIWAKGQRSWDAKDTLEIKPTLTKMALNVWLMATAYGVRCLGADQSVALRAAETAFQGCGRRRYLTQLLRKSPCSSGKLARNTVVRR